MERISVFLEILDTNVNIKDERFQQNESHNRVLVQELKEQLIKVRQGGVRNIVKGIKNKEDLCSRPH